MQKNIIIAAVCALGAWAILSITADLSRSPETGEGDESSAMMHTVDKAKKRAESISPQAALSHLCLSEGVELGKILLQTYPKLSPDELRLDLLRQGLADGVAKPRHPDRPGKSRAYTLAATRIVAAKSGAPAPEPRQKLSPREQQLSDEADALSSQISEQEAYAHLSYTMGLLAAEVFLRQIPLCTLPDLDLQAFVLGLTSTLRGEKLPIFDDKAECMAHGFALAWLIDARSIEAGRRNRLAGQAYLAANATKPGVRSTASGLQYRVITPGSGPSYHPPTHGQHPTCTVTYEGRRVDGSVFDSTGETPVSFPIDAVIPGLSEALKMMPAGAEWEICLPAELGYGATAPSAIGPDATLIFTVKLHGISPQLPPRQGANPGPSPHPDSAPSPGSTPPDAKFQLEDRSQDS